MRYGFVIDHNRCIGCHACTVACKEEHNVPVGVFRTWVKYIEKGEFPDTRRYFGVLRCNHCDDAPCIEICPTRALYRRSDGIVDFDSERCIGCKSCMQACPYDALYIDPASNTAAKCNYCAHRVEAGLEPACVIVCPEQAIIAGDLDDPASRIHRIVATRTTSVRKPEKGTRPKLFYLGVEEDLLQPGTMRREKEYFAAGKGPGEVLYDLGGEEKNGRERPAPGTAREVYDVAHPEPWGKKIAAYLWTKSIAAGVLLVAALLEQIGIRGETALLGVVGPLLALIFLAVTLLLLVFDLKRPDRFYYLLTKPNPRSWLVLGGYLLMGYGLFAALWLLFGLRAGSPPALVRWLSAALGIGAAGYSAFLFAQAKGRDLWQSPLFLWHLLIQAVMAGAAALILSAWLVDSGAALTAVLDGVLAASLVLALAMIMSELYLTHVSEDVKRATDLLIRGELAGRFWGAAVGAGCLLPLAVLAWPGTSAPLSAAASVLALAGLWVFEDLWVRAGQAVPLS